MTHGRLLGSAGALVAVLTALLAAGYGVWSARTHAPAAAVHSTEIAVLNPGPNAVEIAVTYTGTGGACDGQRIDHKTGPRSLKPGELAVFDQGDAAASGLPDGCRAAAGIRATGGSIAAVVLDAGDDGSAAAYNVMNTGMAQTRIAVPRWRKGDGAHRWTTRIHAFNPDGTSSSDARIQFLDATGATLACGAPCSRTIGPLGGATWTLDAIDDLPAGKGGGSAVVVGRLALTVVVEEFSAAGTADTTLSNGLPIGPPADPPDARHLPLVLNEPGGRPVLGPGGRDAANGVGGVKGPAALDAASAVDAIAGPGGSEVVVQNLSTGGTAVVAEFSGGGPSQKVQRVIPDAFGVAEIVLADETALAPGAYAARITADQAVGALARTVWPRSLGVAAYTQAPAGTDVLIPWVQKNDAGRTSIITLHNPDTAARVSLGWTVTAAAGGEPVASGNLVIPAGGTVTLDFGASPELADLPAPFSGWLRVSAQLPVAAIAWIDVADSPFGVAAIEGTVLDRELPALLDAPLVYARWSGDQPPPTATPTTTEPPTSTPTPPRATDTPTPGRDTATPTATEATGQASATPTDGPSPTDVPRATLTPVPGATEPPTAAPTRRPPLSHAGWSRPCGEAEAALEARMDHLALGRDGSLWLRALRRTGEPRILLCQPSQATARAFARLRDGVQQEIDRIRRIGTLRDFWAVDRGGGVWSSGGFFDGQRWVEVARDDVLPEGGQRYGVGVLLDASERAWMPVVGQAECERPTGCALTGVRAFTAAGGADLAITFNDVPEARAHGIPDATFLTPGQRPGPAAGGPTSGLAPSGLTPSGPTASGLAPSGLTPSGRSPSNLSPSGRPAGSDQAPPDQAWVVTPGGLYLPPDVGMTAYPLLGVPPRGGLRNAGYATASTVRPDGRLVVFTWVELQRPRGAEYRIYANTWNGSGWASPDDLTDSPLFGGAVKHERILAAAFGPDGTLWVGTESGKLASMKFGIWGNLFDGDNSPLPPGKPIRGLSVGGDGTLFVLTDAGVLAYAGGEFNPVRIFLAHARKNL